jgi:hypothetical protein
MSRIDWHENTDEPSGSRHHAASRAANNHRQIATRFS